MDDDLRDSVGRAGEGVTNVLVAAQQGSSFARCNDAAYVKEPPKNMLVDSSKEQSNEEVARAAVGIGAVAAVVLVHACAPSPGSEAQDASQLTPPIIDLHLHAIGAGAFGPPPVPACAVEMTFPAPDPGALPRGDRIGGPQNGYNLERAEECDSDFMLPSPMTDEELIRQTFDMMERYNVVTGVFTGSMARLSQWKAVAPDRVIPVLSGGYPLAADSVRKWVSDGTIGVLGELQFQYRGVPATDPMVEPYFALAEELDLPIAFHVGFGPPATPYVRGPTYRVRHSNPLLLEDVLIRDPNVRIYLMEAAWPMLDQLIGLLYAHPQVYVDIGRLTWEIPRTEFHTYLRRLVEAGFGKRIMWGSDAMIWPDVIPVTIEAVESADFLDEDQKRDIFYNNAARFLRLSEEEIARHHGG